MKPLRAVHLSSLAPATIAGVLPVPTLRVEDSAPRKLEALSAGVFITEEVRELLQATDVSYLRLNTQQQQQQQQEEESEQTSRLPDAIQTLLSKETELFALRNEGTYIHTPKVPLRSLSRSPYPAQPGSVHTCHRKQTPHSRGSNPRSRLTYVGREDRCSGYAEVSLQAKAKGGQAQKSRKGLKSQPVP